MKSRRITKNRKSKAGTRKYKKGGDHNSPELEWLENEIEKIQRLIDLALQQDPKGDVTDYKKDLKWYKDVKEEITEIQNKILDKDEQIGTLYKKIFTVETERNDLEQDPTYKLIKDLVYGY